MDVSGKNAAHAARGRAGEEAAATYLKRLGWRILVRNWRPRRSLTRVELDLVAEEKGVLVFVEVKTRSGVFGPGGLTVPAYTALDRRKQNALVLAARLFLEERRSWDAPCRFDLVCLEERRNAQFAVEHYRNVLETGHSLGGGNAPWQPW